MASKKQLRKTEKTIDFFKRKELNYMKTSDLLGLCKLYKLGNVQLNDRGTMIERLLKQNKNKRGSLQKVNDVKKQMNDNAHKISEKENRIKEIEKEINKIIESVKNKIDELIKEKVKIQIENIEILVIQEDLKKYLEDNK